MVCPTYTELIAEDMALVETVLRSPAPGQDPRTTQVVSGLIDSGGKRLRPALALLSAHLCQADIAQAVNVAAGVELLHTATLVHDDQVDGATERRGAPTPNSYLPAGAATLIGDLLFARSAALVTETGNPKMVRAFASTLSTICSGELQQMFGGQNITRTEYDQRIRAKTASLFALCSEAGAILAGAGETVVAALHHYGECLGVAFQIVDDVLDIAGDPDELGKPVGEDLRHGLITLPTLYFLEAHPDHPAVTAALAQCGPGETSKQGNGTVKAAVAAVRASGAPERALQDARQMTQAAEAALDGFAPSPYRDAMAALTGLVVERCR